MKFDLRKFLAVVGQVGPVVLAAIPGGEKIGAMIPKVVEAIGEAEQIKGATGPEKKRHVLNVLEVATGIANDTGRVKLDAGELEEIASVGIDTVIRAVRVVEDANDATPDRVAAEAPEGAPSAEESGRRPVVDAAAGSVPGVDTAPRASDLPGGHATHGHGSADDPPPAPGTAKPPAPGKSKP